MLDLLVRGNALLALILLLSYVFFPDIITPLVSVHLFSVHVLSVTLVLGFLIIFTYRIISMYVHGEVPL